MSRGIHFLECRVCHIPFETADVDNDNICSYICKEEDMKEKAYTKKKPFTLISLIGNIISFAFIFLPYSLAANNQIGYHTTEFWFGWASLIIGAVGFGIFNSKR